MAYSAAPQFPSLHGLSCKATNYVFSHQPELDPAHWAYHFSSHKYPTKFLDTPHLHVGSTFLGSCIPTIGWLFYNFRQWLYTSNTRAKRERPISHQNTATRLYQMEARKWFPDTLYILLLWPRYLRLVLSRTAKGNSDAKTGHRRCLCFNCFV
jgi:hypothetical protein